MLKISEAVIVEGRYDKIKLSGILDALIVETNGFHIYKDKEKLRFIRRLADERGIVIATDSDKSGFQIRSFISQGIDRDKVKHIYIPDIYGKERRKNAPSAEGKLGVEGMDEKLLLSLFEKANIKAAHTDGEPQLTTADLFELGISGTANAAENRRALLKSLDLPENLSTQMLIRYADTSMGREKFIKRANSIINSQCAIRN